VPRALRPNGGDADCTQALPLLDGAVLADKGCYAGYIVDAVTAMGAEAVIPPKVEPQGEARLLPRPVQGAEHD
jgi:hypothetical protein